MPGDTAFAGTYETKALSTRTGRALFAELLYGVTETVTLTESAAGVDEGAVVVEHALSHEATSESITSGSTVAVTIEVLSVPSVLPHPLITDAMARTAISDNNLRIFYPAMIYNELITRLTLFGLIQRQDKLSSFRHQSVPAE